MFEGINFRKNRFNKVPKVKLLDSMKLNYVSKALKLSLSKREMSFPVASLFFLPEANDILHKTGSFAKGSEHRRTNVAE